MPTISGRRSGRFVSIGASSRRTIWVTPMPLVPSSLILPTLLFVIVYAVIISERINRSIVAMVGACLTIGLGGLTQEQALEGVDWNTIGLLTGMMIIVSISRRSGLFQYVAVWSARAAKAHPGRILLAMQLTTAVLSAFLDNVTTVLLIVPVTMAIVRTLDVPAYPYLLAEIFASNIGGTATLIGDPPNILIGSQVGLSFNDFVVHLTPVICVVMAAQLAMIYLVWGRVLCASPERQSRVMLMEPIAEIVDPLLLKQSIIVFLMVVVAFIFARQLHLEPAMIAMSGATALLLLDNWSHQREKASHNIHQTFSDVEWITIFFFIGLFIVVHGLEVAGLLKLLGDRLASSQRERPRDCRLCHSMVIGISFRDHRQHSVRRHNDPPHQEHGSCIRWTGHHPTPLVVSVARRMSWRKWNIDWCFGEPDGGRNCRAEWRAVPLWNLSAVCYADDGGQHCDMPLLCIVEIFLGAG